MKVKYIVLPCYRCKMMGIIDLPNNCIDDCPNCEGSGALYYSWDYVWNIRRNGIKVKLTK